MIDIDLGDELRALRPVRICGAEDLADEERQEGYDDSTVSSDEVVFTPCFDRKSGIIFSKGSDSSSAARPRLPFRSAVTV